MMPNTEAARYAAGWLARHSKARITMIMASADHYVRDSAEPGLMPECIARSRDRNTDLLLHGCLPALQNHGLPADWDISIAVPGRVQVVCFDNTRESRYSSPPLTTVDSFIAKYALMAVEPPIARIEGYDAGPQVLTDWLSSGRAGHHAPLTGGRRAAQGQCRGFRPVCSLKVHEVILIAGISAADGRRQPGGLRRSGCR